MRKTAIFFLILLLQLRIPLANSAPDEGYGEANENLGQFTDTFLNDTFIAVLHNVRVNTTLECVESNFTAEGSMPGWSYLKNHTIIGSVDGQQTNYQVGIKVYYGSGVDGTEVVTGLTFGKVYLDNLCKTDFGDLRFTSGDGLTELFYWIEFKVNSDYAIIWVKIPVIPVNPNTVNILIHYGNAVATTTSDGKNTFPNLFDHFLGPSLNLTVFQVDASSGSVSFADSIIRIQGNAGNNRYSFASKAPFTTADPSALRFLALMELTSASYQIVQVGFARWGITGFAIFQTTAGTERAYTRDSLGNAEIDGLVHAYFDSYFTYEITRGGGVAGYRVDGTLVATGDFNPDTDNIGIQTYVRDSEYDLYLDWCLIREYTPNEPTPSIWVNGTSPAGYFITEDYLNFTTGNSLNLLTNASLPGDSGIIVQFSSDNSTWLDNHGNVGSSTVRSGFSALDLRDLNYSNIFMLYNFTGDARLFQSRLVTTNGSSAGAVGPGVTVVESDAPWIALAIILSIIAFLLAIGIRR